MTARTWGALVAAVPHDADCRSRFGLGVSHPHLAGYVERCACSRDARIAKKLARLNTTMMTSYPTVTQATKAWRARG